MKFRKLDYEILELDDYISLHHFENRHYNHIENRFGVDIER